MTESHSQKSCFNGNVVVGQNSKGAKSRSRHCTIIKKPEGKMIVTLFKQLLDYSDDIHRIVKARVRALCAEYKLNNSSNQTESDQKRSSLKTFQHKSIVRIAQTILAVFFNHFS